MLVQLRVKSIGIIEDIDWVPGQGFNVITGETGVGKSLVIDAVEALLAGKMDDELIRHGDDTAYVEGVFELPCKKENSVLIRLLSDSGIDGDDDSLVINCESRRHRRGTIRINGYAVTKSTLSQVGSLLIDIHGQSDHLSLLDKAHHLHLLDSYGDASELRNSFGAKALELHQAEDELKTLLDEEKEQAHRKELLGFQIDEIRRAELAAGEEEALQRERDIQASSEQLKSLSFQAHQSLSGAEASGDTPSVMEKLSEAVDSLKQLVSLDPTMKEHLDFLQQSVYGIEEAARDIRSYSERTEYDPKRLEEIQARLELIKDMKRKYGPTVADILSYLEKGEKEIEKISHRGERKSQLLEKCSSLRGEMGRIASELSRKRSRAAEKLTADVDGELRDLNMAQVRFQVSITRQKSEEGIPLPDGNSYAYSQSGVDKVEFIAATNPGEPPKPLAKIASTGEISRFALALKSALAGNDDIPVLIFDEIDIGVGGRSGEVIGRKLWKLSREHQVICVTHLPQIAAYADSHYSVHKEVSSTRTTSRMATISEEARIEELAAMLSGAHYSETALVNAREMIHKASQWKRSSSSRE